jgi:hypothetical protein
MPANTWQQRALRYEAALRKIADPISFMRAAAKAEGGTLNAIAAEIADDPYYLRQIAKDALSAR